MRRYLFALFVVTALGCEPLARAQQCRVVAAVVNPALAEMDAELTAEPRGWASLAQKLQVLGWKLSTLHLGEPKINQFVLELTTNFAAASQTASLGIQSRMRGQNDDATVAHWAIVRDRHANIVRGLNRYCR